ncbi:MAG TPA: hypothetical protein VMY16_11435 [Ilumatobacteraceae bacterium]|nr:hypothetical protein [Ilumatobacteraceae bacterium]
MTNQPATFEIGSTYTARSASNYDCIWSWTVVDRTAKFITISEFSEPSKTSRVGVRVWNDIESAMPFGRYSMAPVITADRKAS